LTDFECPGCTSNDNLDRIALVRDPYAGWCGRRGAARPLPIPIGCYEMNLLRLSAKVIWKSLPLLAWGLEVLAIFLLFPPERFKTLNLPEPFGVEYFIFYATIAVCLTASIALWLFLLSYVWGSIFARKLPEDMLLEIVQLRVKPQSPIRKLGEFVIRKNLPNQRLESDTRPRGDSQ